MFPKVFSFGKPQNGPVASGSVITLIEARAPSGGTFTGSIFGTLTSSASINFTGKPVLFILNAGLFSTGGNTKVQFAVQIDSGADNTIAQFFINTANVHVPVSGMIILTPSAGNHVIRLRIRRASGTGALTINADDQLLLYGVEL